MSKYILIFLTMLCACYAKRNYEIQLTHLEMSPESDPTWVDKGTVRITKKSRNHFVVAGTFYLFKNAGNEGMLKLILYNVGVGGNLIPIYVKQSKFCDYLKQEKMMYPHLQKASNLPTQDQCPFPKGNYTVMDYSINEDALPEIIPTGRFLGKSSYHLNNKLVFGYDFEFTVSPVRD